MNNKIKSLLVGGVFIVCLVIVFLILKFTDNPADDSSSNASSESTAKVLYEYDKDDVARIEIKNKINDFAIVRKGIEKWGVEGFVNAPDSTAITGSAASNAAKITTQVLVEENASDLDKYGLGDDNNAEVKVSFRNEAKSVEEFIIGSETPEKGKYYFREKDSKDVYTILNGNISNFLSRKEEFVTLAILQEPAQDDWPIVDEIRVDRSDLDYMIKMVYDGVEDEDSDSPSTASAHIMIEPINAYLDIANSTEITHGLYGLSASEVTVVNPDQKDKDKYGISKPLATLKVKAEQNNYTFYIGNAVYATNENGEETSTISSYYGYFEGIDVIYLFEASAVPWADFKPMDIVSSLMTGNYIFDVSKINFTYQDGKTDTLSMTNDRENLLTAKFRGESIDLDIAKSFYTYIIKSPAEEMNLVEPTGPLLLKLEIVRIDGGKDIVEYYKETDRSVAVKLNGKVSFKQKIGYYNTLISNLERLEKSEDIVLSW